jgi:hypothetical protein
MESPRWLFPFTHGVDMQAIDTVVRFAEERGAILVAVSLIAVPTERRSHGARLEHIQQSTDFLEAVKFKAAAHQVSIERYETLTGNVLGSITLLTHDQRCDRIVLVSSEDKDALLYAHEKKRLLEDPPATLVLLRLPTQKQRTGRIYTRFLSWLRWHWEQQNDTGRGQVTVGVGELSWSRTEEHRWG